MSHLIKRVERATGPDRYIDGLLHARFDLLGRSTRPNDPGRYTVVGPPTYEVPRTFFCPDTGMDWIGYDLENVSPSYTWSLDAALTLCERLLPGHGWLIGRGKTRPDEPMFGVQIHATDFLRAGSPRVIAEAEHSTPALALVLAILKAHPDGGSDA